MGQAAFSGVAGQLRFEAGTAVSGVTQIFGDVNGDSLADFEIRLTSLFTLAASDFAL